MIRNIRNWNPSGRIRSISGRPIEDWMLVSLVEDVRVQKVEQAGCDNKSNQGDSTCGSRHDNFCRLVLYLVCHLEVEKTANRWWKYFEIFHNPRKDDVLDLRIGKHTRNISKS